MKNYIEVSNDDVKRILAKMLGQNAETVESVLIPLPKKSNNSREKVKYEPLYRVYCGDVDEESINNE